MPENVTRRPSDFAAVLRAALPPGVSLGHADPARLYPLAPGEGLASAVPKRQIEFSAGRAAARAGLGLPDQSLPIGPDRAPIWPSGRVGSITHCAGLCLAIVGQSDDYEGLGLDAEPEEDVNPAHWEQILRPDEAAADGLAVLAHFVAKEAAYKAQFPISKQLFGFHCLRLRFSQNDFKAEFMETVLPFSKGHSLHGQILRAGGYLGAVVALRQPQPGA